MATGLSPTCHIGQEVLAALDGRSSSGTQWSSSRRPQGGARDAMVCREWSVVGADMGKERLTGSRRWGRAGCRRAAAAPCGLVRHARGGRRELARSALRCSDTIFFIFSFHFPKINGRVKKKLEKYTYGAAPPQRQEFLPPSGTVVGVPPTVG
jgi:hypothetical protein